MNRHITYASYFVSFLLSKLKSMGNIKQVILFGSAAIGEAEKGSDIDLFIDIKKTSAQVNKLIFKIEQDFYKTREAMLFRMQGISNKISIIVGRLKEWEDLHYSISSTGIVLYGKTVVSEYPKHAKKQAIFFWSRIRKNRGAFLNKLYGFKSKGKRYEGLLKQWGGKHLGKSCIMIPIEVREDFIKLTRRYKVDCSILEVFI